MLEHVASFSFRFRHYNEYSRTKLPIRRKEKLEWKKLQGYFFIVILLRYGKINFSMQWVINKGWDKLWYTFLAKLITKYSAEDIYSQT